ncbi:MAG TPA: MFS transporter [Candidatus Sulfotelmatobacter sp.]|nr:MFS transporter [Candidatus Sulfotelmatobacter sp.]
MSGNEVVRDRAELKAGQSSLTLVLMLIAMTAFSQFFRTSVGTIAPELRVDIGLDARLLGLANGSFFIAFLVLQLPLGVLFDRYGVRRCVVALTGLAALGSLWGAYAFDPWSFIASRVLVGIGSAGYFMGALVVAGAWFRDRRFVGVLSWVYALSNIGTLAATAPLSAAAEGIGWRAAFAVIAAITLALGLALHLFLRDSPADATTRLASGGSPAALVDGWREVWRTPGLAPILAMAAIAYASVSTMLGTWAAPYLNDVFGAGPYVRGEWLLVFAVAQVAGTLGWGQIAAHRVGTGWVIVRCAAAGVVVLGLLALWPNPPLWLAAGLVACFCLLASFGSLVMMEGRQLFPEHIAGRGITTVNLSQVGGSALLPVVTGAIIGWAPAAGGEGSALAYRLAFGVIALCLLAGLLAYRHLPRE